LWRLRFIVTDDGELKQTERIFRGSQTAARRRLRQLIGEAPAPIKPDRTLGASLDEGDRPQAVPRCALVADIGWLAGPTKWADSSCATT
jgi:hypothetical protein